MLARITSGLQPALEMHLAKKQSSFFGPEPVTFKFSPVRAITIFQSLATLASLSLRAKLLTVIAFLGLVPAIGAGVTLLVLHKASHDSAILDRASRGAIHLEQINGLVYNVVMESRGIYMSRDWSSADPFAKNLMAALARMRAVVAAWNEEVIDEQKSNVAALINQIDQFANFRTELVRLAREENTTIARAFGDNDTNRKVRSQLNGNLDTIARSYEQVVRSAREKVTSNNRNIGMVLAGLAALAAATLALGLWLVSRELIAPLARIKESMNQIALGRRDADIIGADRRDEIGDMARMVEVFKSNAIEQDKLEQGKLEAASRETASQHAMQALVDEFHGVIVGITGELEREQGCMRSAAQSLSSSAITANDRSIEAANESAGAADNTHAVSAATEELSASISEISSQAHRASTIVDAATRQAKVARGDVEALAQASNRIEVIIKLITDIAGQTNLLALNATIEAARAGEAGRGFAVVASEVKALANRTAQASSEVAELVKLIRSSTGTTVHSISRITSRIDEIASLTGTIAAAVEEQQAATQEIARSVTQAANSTRSALECAASVKVAASETHQQSRRVETTATALASISSALSERVDNFLRSISQDIEERRKSVRRPVQEALKLTVGGDVIDAIAVDSSLGGLRIRPNPGLSKGQQLTVTLAIGVVPAHVVWVDEEQAGIGFDKRLDQLPF